MPCFMAILMKASICNSLPVLLILLGLIMSVNFRKQSMDWRSLPEPSLLGLVSSCVSWDSCIHKLTHLYLCFTLEISPSTCLSMWTTLWLLAHPHMLLGACFSNFLPLFLLRTLALWIIFSASRWLPIPEECFSLNTTQVCTWYPSPSSHGEF
jgi:hypothetical protein